MSGQKILLILALIFAILAAVWGGIPWGANNRIARADLLAVAFAFFIASLLV